MKSICILLTMMALTGTPHLVQAQKKVELGVVGSPLMSFKNGYSGYMSGLALRIHLNDRLALGNNFFFQSSTDIGLFDRTSNARAFIIHPHLRYYFKKTKRFNLFLEGGIGIAFVKQIRDHPLEVRQIHPDYATLTASLGIGLEYELTERLKLEASYQLFSGHTNTYGFMIGLTYRLGGGKNKKKNRAHRR